MSPDIPRFRVDAEHWSEALAEGMNLWTMARTEKVIVF